MLSAGSFNYIQILEFTIFIEKFLVICHEALMDFLVETVLSIQSVLVLEAHWAAQNVLHLPYIGRWPSLGPPSMKDKQI